MAGVWQIFKGIVQEKKKQNDDSAKKGEPIDRDLPLGLHMDALVELDQTLFILAGEGQLHLTFPGIRNVVAAIGFLKLDQWTIRHFYLHSERNVDEQSVLRIITEGNKNTPVTECRLFRLLDEIYPSSNEEWDFWLSERDGSIGLSQFQSKDGVMFDRVWDADNAARIAPYMFHEKIYLDRYGSQSKSVSHQSMTYGRQAMADPQVNEYILLSLEEENFNEANISILAGIDIEPRAIKVVY